MTSILLGEFVRRALDEKRVRFGELRRLQRNILPEGITSREEAEILVALDRTLATSDKEWTEYLTSAIRKFVVQRSGEPKQVDHETAEWLVNVLSDCRSPKTAVRIAKEIACEAESVDPVLLALADGGTRKGRRSDRRSAARTGEDHLSQGAP
jgi:hypothetical protein